MDIEYSILWFEDYKRFPEGYIKRIREHLKDYGVILSPPIIKENADKLESILQTQEFDLILMDLNLGESETETLSGDEVIKRIRGQQVYTDVVFYSRVQNIREKEYSLEGTYFAETDGDKFFEKVKQVIDWNLNRSLNITVIRGIFIATTIDLVQKMEEIIHNILRLKDPQLAFFKDSIIEAEFFNDEAKTEIIKDFLKNEIQELRVQESKLTGVALKTLEDKIEDLERILETLCQFKIQVLGARNKLARAQCVSGERSTLCIRDRDSRINRNVRYDKVECIEIRKRFIAQGENLDKIAKFVESLQAK